MTDATRTTPDPAFLDGVRVLELSTRPAGAYCGLLLASMGATVLRWSAPLSADCPTAYEQDLAASIHRGKQHIAGESRELAASVGSVDVIVVDCLHDDDFDGVWTERARRLIPTLDAATPVVDLSTFRREVAAALPDPEEPRTPGTPLTVNAASAMAWSMGHRDQVPLALPYDLPEYFAAAEGATAAALALLIAEQEAVDPPAERQIWDVASADVLAAFVGQIASNFLPYERPWMRDGARASMSGGFYPAAMFATRDGFVTLVSRTHREWEAIRRAMGDPEWSRRPEYQDARHVARFHADEADPHVAAWVAEHTSAEMVQMGEDLKFPCTKILTPSEAMEVEQFAFHAFLAEDEHGRATIPREPWYVTDGPPVDAPALPMRPSREAPLAGLRILDLSWVWSGPMVTAALADLGAEVIKIEGRSRPDPSRLRGAAIRDGVAVTGPELELSPYFTQMNRGKRSVAVDIATPAGAEVIRDLAATCDVVVENMRPGALARRGLDYENLVQRNPGLIMLSMSMMGQRGPMAQTGGYAPVMSATAGLDALIGYGPGDLIGTFNPALGDPNGAVHAMAVLGGALVRRRRTGRGCWIDLAQIESLVSTLRVPLAMASRGETEVPMNRHARFGPHGIFRCAGDDAWVAVAVRTDDERSRVARVLGCSADVETLAAALDRWCAVTAPTEVARVLRAEAVAAEPVVGVEAVIADERTRERRLTQPRSHPYLGDVQLFGTPLKLNGRSYRARRSAPAFGEHTDEVLAEVLGLGDDERRRRRDLHAIG